jgi:transposase-like protein
MPRIKAKTWTLEEKTQIVLTLLQGASSIAELARKHGVSQTSISKWKDKFLEGGQAALAGRKTIADVREAEVEQLKLALADAVMLNAVLKKLSGSKA